MRKITDYYAKYYAHELSRRHSVADSEKLAGALLDAIISVGYRVKSHTATRFRQWATQHLNEYLVKGFVMDDERLKNFDQPLRLFR